MACTEDIHISEVKPFIATIIDGCDINNIVDISQASEMKIYFKKPASAGSVVLERSCSFLTDGTDGKIYYKTLSTDLDVKGTWKRQCRVVTPDGEFYSDTESFTVYPNLNG